MDVSSLAANTLEDLLRMSPNEGERGLRLECVPLAKALIEASGGGGPGGGGGPEGAAVRPLAVLSDEQRLQLDECVARLNLTSASEAAGLLHAASAQLLQNGQMNVGRAFAFLALMVIVIQRVDPGVPSLGEMPLLADCVADCLAQLRQSCAHCHCKPKWGSTTTIATGMFLIAGALICGILLKRAFTFWATSQLDKILPSVNSKTTVATFQVLER
ncbi:hypothetical protein scyTo_0003337 [Scyliorhinus torazame]|uniref:Uncharacterized protein n=1 Tax=Scyliorhinus torazame TaxID=75743 RepID=A0A401PMA8_SCYTO|nr:hypothetical protein [Scyliorhinus torazame]